MRYALAITLAALAAGAASPPPAASEEAVGAVWGYVRLVPREGVAEATGGAHAYGDRDVSGAQLVDYSTPGFAVVYAEGEPAADERASIAVVASPTGMRLEPAHAALGAGGKLSIANRSDAAHVLSCPRAGLVRSLAAGESIEVTLDAAGEWPVYLLDVPGERAQVFAAAGPYQVVSPAGRFELEDLPAGDVRVHAWHPRFPGASATTEVLADDEVRVDLELRVDRPEGGDAD
jgi:hypothetical protein